MSAPLDAARLLEDIELLNVQLAWWADRDNARDGASITKGHEAVGTIDSLSRQLDRLRSALIGELRRDEDDRAVRVDAMLAKTKAERALQALL